MAALARRRQPLQPVMADRDLMAGAGKGIHDMGGGFLVVFDQQNLHGLTLTKT
jgi:hypothetical protein